MWKLLWKDKKNERLSFNINDMEYIYQYIVLKYDEVKFFRTVFFMLVKNKDDFFEFINILDPTFLEKSSMIYVTESTEHNMNIFDSSTNDILELEITKELVDFLKMKINNWKLFAKIDTEYNWLFKSKWIIFWVFIIVLSLIIYMIWSQFYDISENSWWWLKVDMSTVFFFYDNNFMISLFFFAIVSSLFILKYIKHLPLMEYNFSKYYLLLKYKEQLYIALLKNYLYKWENKPWEIWYMNPKSEFLTIYNEIFKYLNNDEITEVLFFLENDDVQIQLKNPLLKQDVVLDYKTFKFVQNNNVKEKMTFFKTVKTRNESYYDLLKMNYENEFEKLKWYMNMKWLFMYLWVTLCVVIMIWPVLLSAL